MDELGGVRLEHHDARLAEVRLHVVAAGPEDGPLVVLLHGFPELWYGWRFQIPTLARAGYRVLAPDQRGYNRSDKPSGLGPYRLDALVGDVAGLVQWAGRDRARAVVGHDWGGAVTWWLGATCPELTERLVVLNCPHPAAFQALLLASPRQLLRSWYILAFQVPGVPERLLRQDGFAALERAMLRSGRPGVSFRPADLPLYRTAWARPGALSGMLAWYRAVLRYPPLRRRARRVPLPVALLWGLRDVALGPELIERSLARCEHGHAVRFEQATHWVQHDEPEGVNAELLRFLAARG